MCSCSTIRWVYQILMMPTKAQGEKPEKHYGTWQEMEYRVFQPQFWVEKDIGQMNVAAANLFCCSAGPAALSTHLHTRTHTDTSTRLHILAVLRIIHPISILFWGENVAMGLESLVEALCLGNPDLTWCHRMQFVQNLLDVRYLRQFTRMSLLLSTWFQHVLTQCPASIWAQIADVPHVATPS